MCRYFFWVKLKIFIIIIIFILLSYCNFIFSQEVNRIEKHDLERAVVAICHSRPEIKNIIGTGFIVKPTGIILTADHVITDSNGKIYDELFAIRPNYPKSDSYRLTVVKRFREGVKGRDIVILKIISEFNSSSLTYLSIGEKPKNGDPILIVGFPLVFDKVYEWPLFRGGIIASTRYNYENSSILILDLGSVPGYSGSPVISIEKYKVVGVFLGKSKVFPETDFSVATSIDKSDIDF